jgi:peptide/nickel transport system ATP-binding protein
MHLPDPERLLETYPEQLSAGMRRRILIALALACRPALLIADEPTTGLDAPTQAKIIDLFAELRRDEGMCVIFVTHDLAALAQIATDIVVMYAGRVVEAGTAESILGAPQHPYTIALLSQIRSQRAGRSGSPSPLLDPARCFYPRRDGTEPHE